MLLLLAGFLLALTSSYGQTHFISAFSGEIRDSFALSQGHWAAIYAAGTIASAAVMVFAGTLSDRFRVASISTVVMLGLAGACLAMAALRTPVFLVVVIFMLRLTGQGMMGHLSGVAMSRWFVATRGKALAISSLGFAGGQAVIPLIVVSLLPVMDWRLIWIGAALLIVLTIPLTRALLRQERQPGAAEDETHAEGMGGRHWTRGEALRNPVFWLMLPAIIGPPAWGTALFFHKVHLAEVKGWGLVEFIALFPALTLVSVAITFLNGWLIDRVGAPRIMRLAMLPFALTFFTLAGATTMAGATLGMLFFGFSLGLVGTLVAAFWAEIYGTRHIGSIKSVSSAAMVLGSALGPGITGVAIDLGFPLPDQMYLISGYFVLAFLCAIMGTGMARKTAEAPAPEATT